MSIDVARYVLSPDVQMRPAAELGADIRWRITDSDDDVVLSRAGSRTPSVVVDAQSATLINHFSAAAPIVGVIIEYCRNTQANPRDVLDAAYPVLKKLIEREFLLPADAPDQAAPPEPTLGPGVRCGGIEITATIQVLDDVEVHRGANENGPVAVKLARCSGPRVASRIRHESQILTLLADNDHGERPVTGEHDGRPFVAVRWHDGTNADNYAAALRTDGGPAAHHRLRRCAVAIAEAYADLHTAGVLHGDVHPRNVVMGSQGSASIVDFGSARRIDGGGWSPPRAGVSFYFEPEYARALMRGDPPPATTPAGEQYAVAAMLYKLLTGHHYADFYFDNRIWKQIPTSEPITFADRGASAWPAGERILQRALAKEPDARYPDLTSFAHALRDACGPPPSVATNRVPFDRVATSFIDATVRRLTTDTVVSGDVNQGAAGRAYALLRLSTVRRDGELLARADAMIDRACHEPIDATSGSLYLGAAGTHLVRALIASAQGDTAAVSDAAAWFRAAACVATDSGDVFGGRAGLLIASSLLLNAVPQECDEHARIASLGHWLAAALDERLAAKQPGAPWVGIAHGTGGMLYAALQWSELSGTPVSPTVGARLAELGALATESAGATGALRWWPQRYGPEDPRRGPQPGWCHGSAGHALLHVAAHRATGDVGHLGIAEHAARYAYERCTGSGINLCCGMAGEAYACLSLFRVAGDEIWLRRAEDLALRAIDRAQRTTWDDGLFTGLAGLAVLCADLQDPVHSHMPLFECEPLLRAAQ